MGLLYDHLSAHAVETRSDDTGYKVLQSMPVYEISNVLGLFDDWDREGKRRVPRRPPNDYVWAEWVHDYQGVREQRACIIGKVGTGAPPEMLDSMRKLEGCDEFYLCTAFVKILSISDKTNLPNHLTDHVFRTVAGRIMASGFATIVGLGEDSSFINEKQVVFQRNTTFGLPQTWVDKSSAEEDPWAFSWPPFMAFSLLHCRNVRTEVVPPDPDPHAERRRNRGLPPKKEYHVLRLELPNELRPQGQRDSEETERRVRFHLCRGHFKNLQHERYKNKGWHWWPAHWKGSKDLGTVEKSYELRGREAVG